MKKSFHTLRPFIIIILLLITLYILRPFLSYLSFGKNPNVAQECEEKRVDWGKNTYLIDSLPSGDKLVMKVISLHKNSWYTLLKPVSSPSEQFTTCVKGVKRYPDDLITRSKAGKELQERSHGVDISIGIQKHLSYKEIANMTLTIELYTNKFTDEDYNLDAALQHIADNYRLEQRSDSSWILIFTAPVGEDFDQNLPFYYEFAQLNDKEIPYATKFEFKLPQ